MFNRRTFLAGSAAGGLIPASNLLAASKKVEPRINLKKNVILVSLDLGLYAPNFQENGASCKYMTEIFSEFKGQMTYFDGISEKGIRSGHESQPATFTTIPSTVSVHCATASYRHCFHSVLVFMPFD